jgi:hypothetical protein
MRHLAPPRSGAAHRGLLLVLLLAAGVAAGCSAGTAPTPVAATLPPGPSTAAPADDGALAEAGGADTGATAADAVVVSNDRGGAATPEGTMTADPVLEAAIPSAVGELQLDIVSLTGEQYLARSGDTMLMQMISDVHLQPADVTLAIGIGQLDGQQLAIAAFRFPGVEEATLTNLFRDELIRETGNATARKATIGGRDVLVVDDPADAIMATYLIVDGDMARVVQASVDDLAEAAVGTLP